MEEVISLSFGAEGAQYPQGIQSYNSSVFTENMGHIL